MNSASHVAPAAGCEDGVDPIGDLHGVPVIDRPQGGDHKLKAMVAIARSILVIIWHLLTNRSTRYHDLGASYHTSRIDQNRKMRNHIRQLQALGCTVTLTQAA